MFGEDLGVASEGPSAGGHGAAGGMEVGLGDRRRQAQLGEEEIDDIVACHPFLALDAVRFVLAGGFGVE